MKVIEVIADIQYRETIEVIAEHHQVDDVWFGAENEDGRIGARLLVTPENRQGVLDELQEALQSSENARILILPIEAALTTEKASDKASEKNGEEKNKTVSGSSTISREEIFSHVEKGAQMLPKCLEITDLSRKNKSDIWLRLSHTVSASSLTSRVVWPSSV